MEGLDSWCAIDFKQINVEVDRASNLGNFKVIDLIGWLSHLKYYQS